MGWCYTLYTYGIYIWYVWYAEELKNVNPHIAYPAFMETLIYDSMYIYDPQMGIWIRTMSNQSCIIWCKNNTMTTKTTTKQETRDCMSKQYLIWILEDFLQTVKIVKGMSMETVGH